MPTIDQLRYLVALAKHQHFGRAAKSCAVSQPSLSNQIQKVEQELGVVLFDRSQSPVIVTEMGQKLIAQAKAVLHEHEKLKVMAQVGRGEVAGEFRLGVIPTLAPYLVPHFYTSFKKAYPAVHLIVRELKTEDIVEQLEDDELDGGLLVTPLKNDRIIERSLFYERFFVFCSENHALAKSEKVREEDLDPSSVILLSEGHCFRTQAMSLCQVDPGQPRSFDGGSLETLMNIIKDGDGYTLVPELAALGLPKTTLSRHVRGFAGTSPTREVSLVHARSFLKESIIEVLTGHIADSLPKDIKSHRRSDRVIPILS